MLLLISSFNCAILQPVEKGPKKTARKGQPDSHSAAKNHPSAPLVKKRSTAQPPLFNSGRTERGTFAPANQYAWPPGKSGNPGGRPKGKRISDAIKDYLQRPHPDDPDGNTLADIIGWRLAARAAGISTGPLGNVKTLELLLDRVDGKARQTIENVNHFDAERWLRVSNVLVTALEPFPEARDALLAALDKINTEDQS